MLQFAFATTATFIFLLITIWYIFKKAEKFSQRISQHFAETDLYRDNHSASLALNAKAITERLDQQQLVFEGLLENAGKIPKHNSTMYFNDDGEMMNLNIEQWSIEIEKDFTYPTVKDKKHLRQLGAYKEHEDNASILKIYIRKNKIIFDRFVMDLNKSIKTHKNYPIAEYTMQLMRTANLNIKQLTFEFTDGLAETTQLYPIVYHRGVSALFLNILVEHVKPLYEAHQNELAKQEEAEKIAKLKQTADGKIYEGDKADVLIFRSSEKESIIREKDENYETIYEGSVIGCPFEVLNINERVAEKIRKKEPELDWMIVTAPVVGGIDKGDVEETTEPTFEPTLMQKAEERSEGLKLVEPADDETSFILNGKVCITGESFLSYENIIKLAGALDEKEIYSVTYSYKDSRKSGIVCAGQHVEVSDDLIINAMVTNNS